MAARFGGTRTLGDPSIVAQFRTGEVEEDGKGWVSGEGRG